MFIKVSTIFTLLKRLIKGIKAKVNPVSIMLEDSTSQNGWILLSKRTPATKPVTMAGTT